MTKILVTYDMFREGFTELESKYEVTFPEGRDFTYEEVLEDVYKRQHRNKSDSLYRN